MSPEAQRIAIATVCGRQGPFNQREWLKEYDREDGDVFADLAGTDTGGYRALVPDYLNDLNAMHEAEKVLADNQWTDYANALTDLAPCSRRGMISATAAQRAEAFLKTLNLWTP